MRASVAWKDSYWVLGCSTACTQCTHKELFCGAFWQTPVPTPEVSGFHNRYFAVVVHCYPNDHYYIRQAVIHHPSAATLFHTSSIPIYRQ